VDNCNNITNSQNRVRKKSFGGTFCFSNCHIIRLDTGGLVFLVSGINIEINIEIVFEIANLEIDIEIDIDIDIRQCMDIKIKIKN
jgi:hypothetical protein